MIPKKRIDDLQIKMSKNKADADQGMINAKMREEI